MIDAIMTLQAWLTENNINPGDINIELRAISCEAECKLRNAMDRHIHGTRADLHAARVALSPQSFEFCAQTLRIVGPGQQ